MADLLTKQSLLALSFVGGLVGTAVISASISLPKRTSTKARSIFIWLAFDALCHFTLEVSFLYLSVLFLSLPHLSFLFVRSNSSVDMPDLSSY